MATISTLAGVINQHIRAAEVETIITFRTQQLMDLWYNEIQGQISDGMWENSRNTDWIWRHVWVKLGEETKVESKSWHIGRKNFFLTKELEEIIGERATEEAGFDSMKSMREGWKEIATAIRNVSSFSETSSRVIDIMKAEEESERRATEAALMEELKEVAKAYPDHQLYEYINEVTIRVAEGKCRIEVYADAKNKRFLLNKNMVVMPGKLEAVVKATADYLELVEQLRK